MSDRDRDASIGVALAAVLMSVSIACGGGGSPLPDAGDAAGDHASDADADAEVRGDANVDADVAGDATADATTDATPDVRTRGYRLASSGASLDPMLGPQLADTDLATDVDVVNIHQDFFGVPWEAFAANAPPAPAWTALMTDIAQRAHATGKEIFLALAPLDGSRDRLAGNVVADGATFRLDKAWKPACYDLTTAADGPALRAAYARYVDYMVRLFQPRWTNVAVEVSLWHLLCRATWDGMVALERDAYAAAKAAAPAVPAFPSIQIDILYGRVGCPAPMTADACYETEYASLANLQRDRFAVSTYPHNFVGFDRPQDVPADWLTRAADRGGERPFIAEVGWLSTDLVVTDQNGRCLTAIANPAAEAADWLDRLVADAIANRVEVINWISNRDFMPAQVLTECPCAFSTTWCGVVDFVRAAGATPIDKRNAEISFKVFGTMGIRDYDGNPHAPIFARWQAARVDPVAP